MKTMLDETHAPLRAAVRRLFDDSCHGEMPALTVENLSARPWMSATFTGETHRLGLRLRSAADLRRVRARLRGFDPDLAGHVLVDIAVVDVRRERGAASVVLQALTIED